MTRILMTTIRTFAYGSNRMLFHYATALRAAGHDVVVAYEQLPSEDDAETASILPELNAAGIETRHVPQIALAAAPLLGTALIAAVRKYGSQLVISNQLRDAAGAMATARKCGIPGVAFAQGLPYFQGNPVARRCKELLYRHALRSQATRIICVAPAIQRQLTERFNIHNDKICTILNGLDLRSVPLLDPEHRASVRSELGFSHDEFVFLNIGRFDRVKGLDILVEAVREMTRTGPVPFKVIIAADANSPRAVECRGTIVELIEQSNLQTVFVLPGFRDDCNRLLQASDCFLLPSRSEGLPLTVLEAFAAECPVIMSEYGERFDAFHNGTDGVYVPVEDPVALATAMKEMVNAGKDQRQAMGQSGRRYLERCLTLDRAKQQFVEEIERVAAGRQEIQR